MATDRMICVRRGDIVYCWNFENHRREKYAMIADGDEWPSGVMSELLTLMDEKLSEREKQWGNK